MSPSATSRQSSGRLSNHIIREALDLLICSAHVPGKYRYARLVACSRRNNEDRAEVFERGDAVVVVVADGAGGMRGGADASDATVAAVSAAGHDPAFDIHEVQSWMNVLADVDHNLAKTMGGETTAIVAVIGPGGIIGAAVGDSQAWVITETGIDDLTCAQSKKRLGSGRASPVPFYRPRLEGTLVVASDGLWNYIPMHRVAEVVRGRAPVDAAEGLRDLVQRPSGKYRDDLGVVVVAAVGTSPR